LSEFPYKVKHKNGSVGVATGVHKIKDGYYYKVKRINGTKSQSNWSLGMAEPCDPNEVGNRVDSRTYVRNNLIDRVGIASAVTFHNGRPTYLIAGEDGKLCSKWYVANCVEISKKDYEKGDKSRSRVWNKGRKQQQKTGSGRICRMCNKEITNGNWWYCADCNRKRLLSIAHHERMEEWV
jgi:hypothetical protein